MRLSILLSAVVAAQLAVARSFLHTGHKIPQLEKRNERRVYHPHPQAHPHVRRPSALIPQNENTTKFAVDGTAIPDVDFDIGESYAGLLPISSAANASELYFWFFPTDNDEGKDTLTIWLNVGTKRCTTLACNLQKHRGVQAALL